MSLSPHEGPFPRLGAQEVYESTYSALPTARSNLPSAPSLPTIAPSLVMPVARTRLAIPIESVEEPEFDVDVLGIYGMPLLCAVLSNSPGIDGNIHITSHGVDTILAVVTPRLQILDSEGKLFASLTRSRSDLFLLQDQGGRVLLTICLGSQVGEVKMVTPAGARSAEFASVFRRPAGHLPKEHYEIIVSANVDSVLVLATYLAIIVFALPPLR